jgi:triacylglycerol lipase
MTKESRVLSNLMNEPPKRKKSLKIQRAIISLSILLLISIITIGLTYYISLEKLDNNETLPKQYSIERIHLFVKMAKGAYQTKQENQNTFGTQYRVLTIDLPIYEGQALLLFDDENKNQYISSRGTSNIKNAIEDGEYKKVFDEKTGLYIHEGFLKSAQETYHSILPKLKPEYTTFITGHSLGAAEAAILHIYLLKDNYHVEQTINFGQPKFTNSAGVEMYADLPILRVVHGNDPVPLLPPNTLISDIDGTYDHLGPELVLLDGIYYSFLNTSESDEDAAIEFWGDLLADDIKIQDHYIDHYIASIDPKLLNMVSVPFNKREKYLH